jgi:deoxyribose-phosphate aldolase
VNAPSAEDRPGLAARIDHTLLDPTASAAEIDRLCDEALSFGFANVCVHPVWVKRCATRLGGGSVGVCAVAGFPLGGNLPEVKALEARRAVEAGAREVDAMIHLGALKEGHVAQVHNDLAEVVAAASPAIVKAILETSRLSHDEKVTAAKIAVEAGATFVKTSTGFAGAGATVEDVRLLRAVVGPDCGVKASGGVRTAAQALALLAAGASRIGASASVQIVLGGEA